MNIVERNGSKNEYSMSVSFHGKDRNDSGGNVPRLSYKLNLSQAINKAWVDLGEKRIVIDRFFGLKPDGILWFFGGMG
jgi:hypothetical protein